MSIELLRMYIAEALMDQNVVKKDPKTGMKILRKVVTFKKSTSRFGVGQDVDVDLNANGDMVVDDAEKWYPDYEADAKRAKAVSRSKKIHRVA
jgi:hypothetical protein